MQNSRVRKLVLVAILGAMANVLLLLRFPLPFLPTFMDFDLAGFPEIVGAYTMGPLAGVAVAVIKILLKLMIQPSTSMYTGEIQNLLLSCVYILPAAVIYHRKKTKRAALAGLIIGTLACAVVAVLTNMFIIIPLYAKLFGWSMDQIITMTQKVNKYIDSEWKFVALGIIPFNLIKSGVTTLVVYLTYPILMRITGGGKEDKNEL